MGYREKWATISPSRSPQFPGLLLIAPMENVPLSLSGHNLFFILLCRTTVHAGVMNWIISTKFLCWKSFLTFGPENMSVFGERLYKRVKWQLTCGWAYSSRTSVIQAETVIQTHGKEDHMIHGEKTTIRKSKEETAVEATMLHFDLRVSSLQNCEKINPCCLIHPVCGHLL